MQPCASKKDKDIVVFKVVGQLGAKIDYATGKVLDVLESSQAKRVGVQRGWQLVHVDNAPYSRHLLEQHISAGKPFSLTFLKCEDQRLASATHLPQPAPATLLQMHPTPAILLQAPKKLTTMVASADAPASKPEGEEDRSTDEATEVVDITTTAVTKSGDAEALGSGAVARLDNAPCDVSPAAAILLEPTYVEATEKMVAEVPEPHVEAVDTKKRKRIFCC